MVLAVAGRCIDAQNLVNRLPGIDFLSNQTRLIVDAAKARHQQQRDIDSLSGIGHRSPSFRRQRRQSLHSTNEIGPYFDEFKCLVEYRRPAVAAVIGRNAEFLVQFA